MVRSDKSRAPSQNVWGSLAGLLKTRWYAVVAQAVPPAFTSTSDFGDSQLMVRGENLAKRVGQVGNLRTACESVHPGAAGTRCTDSQNRRREP
jgi:hypothetical protein